ncbi:MAG: F0F1 ATP synthase subunit epsilon [Bacteroidetes bacterium]|nr:F0F1 ATP synthase subunit epsilon [Bacteroidota bacterium]
MTLRILLPEKVLLERAVRKVVAEGESGSFGLLPRHVDFVEPLVPGILSFVAAHDERGDEVFVAVDEGVLVKCGHAVFVSVRNAVVGPELGTLEETVRNRFQRIDEHENAMRTALAKMESEVIRSFIEFE